MGIVTLSFYFVLAAIVVWLPGVAVYCALRERGQTQTMCVASVATSVGASGYLVFFTALLSVELALAVGLGIWLASAFVLIRARQGIDVKQLGVFLCALLLGFIYLSILTDRQISDDLSQQAAVRYWLSVDNKIPRVFADALIERQKLDQSGVADWHLSDRPPLLTGIILAPYAALKDAYPSLAYQPLAMVANLLWVFSLWSFLTSIGLQERDAAITVITVAFVGCIFLSGVYVWPKLLAASLGLSAAVFARANGGKWAIVASAVTASLAMLAHGAIAFGLIGLLPAVVAPLRNVAKRHLILAAVAGFLMYFPWIVFQKVVDPPGDRLLKWHLAGQIPVDQRSFREAITDRLLTDGVSGTVAAKIRNIEVLFGIPFLKADYVVREVRLNTVWYLGPAPGILLIGIFLSIAVRRLREHPVVRQLWSVIAASAIVFCLIESGADPSAVTWLHHAPYSLVLLWTALGAVSLALLRSTIGYGILIANGVSFYLVWVNTLRYQAALQQDTDLPIISDTRIWMFICLALMIGLVLRKERAH